MSINQIAEDLKDIPQAKLIQYVQDPNSVVPQFLALAEIQRRKTLERSAGAGMPQSTVAQDIMKQASQQGIVGQPGVMGQPGVQQQQGLPAMERPQGVAALPTGMGEMSYAGGGIVAFAGDKGSEVEDPYADNEYMQRVLRNKERVSEGFDLGELGKLKNWDPVQSSYRAVKQGIIDPWNRFRNEGTREQAVKFNAASEARTGERPTFVDRPEDVERDATAIAAARQKDMEQAKKDSGPKPDSLGRYVANSGSVEDAPSNTTYAGNVPGPRMAGSAPAAPTPSASQAAPKEDMYSKYEQMLKEQAAESKAGREQDKYMRLIEAGLGMMGGTSQYALTNIGQGAMGAAKGYAQDLAAQRKEDRDNVKELMGLGMKREEAEREAKKLAMTEKLYASHGRYYDAAAGAQGARAAGTTTGMDKAKLAAVTQRYNAWYRLNPMATPQEQQAKMLEIEQQVGMGGGGAGPAQNTISYGDFLSGLKK